MSASLLTTSEAADRLGLTIRAVQKMIENGRLEARKVGRDYLIDPGALENIPKQMAGRPPKSSTPAPKRATGPARAVTGPATAKKKGGKK
ncbi:MAG: helix-turn-helix domain-containing protein [Pyrinomonadaceae bacterium]